MGSFGELVMRIGKTLTALKLATGVPRDWNVPPALWSYGQMKAFLVISPSCALCTLHRTQRATQWCLLGCLCCLTRGCAARFVLGTGYRCSECGENSVYRQGTWCCCLPVLALLGAVPGILTSSIRTVHSWKEAMCLN